MNISQLSENFGKLAQETKAAESGTQKDSSIREKFAQVLSEMLGGVGANAMMNTIKEVMSVNTAVKTKEQAEKVEVEQKLPEEKPKVEEEQKLESSAEKDSSDTEEEDSKELLQADPLSGQLAQISALNKHTPKVIAEEDSALQTAASQQKTSRLEKPAAGEAKAETTVETPVNPEQVDTVEAAQQFSKNLSSEARLSSKQNRAETAPEKEIAAPLVELNQTNSTKTLDSPGSSSKANSSAQAGAIRVNFSELSQATSVKPPAESQVSGSKSAAVQEIGALTPMAAAGDKTAALAKGKALSTLAQSRQQEIIQQLKDALKTASKTRDPNTIVLRLNPPELGNMTLRLTQKDESLYARIIPDSPEVEAVLRARSTELTQVLNQAGLKASEVHVSIGRERSETEVFAPLFKPGREGFDSEMSRFGQGQSGFAEGEKGRSFSSLSEPAPGAQAKGTAFADKQLVDSAWVA